MIPKRHPAKSVDGKLDKFEKTKYNGVFQQIAEKWGLSLTDFLEPDVAKRNKLGAKYDAKMDNAFFTKQGVNYHTCPAEEYRSAWLVDDQALAKKNWGPKGQGMFRFHTKDVQKGITMAWIAGPNCSATGRLGKSMVRTMNAHCASRDIWGPVNPKTGEFPKLPITAAKEAFLHAGRKAALRAGFDGLRARGVTVAIATKVSGGIYAGDFKAVKGPEFNKIVQSVLEEKVDGIPRGNYFHKVILAHLDK